MNFLPFYCYISSDCQPVSLEGHFHLASGWLSGLRAEEVDGAWHSTCDGWWRRGSHNANAVCLFTQGRQKVFLINSGHQLMPCLITSVCHTVALLAKTGCLATRTLQWNHLQARRVTQREVLEEERGKMKKKSYPFTVFDSVYFSCKSVFVLNCESERNCNNDWSLNMTFYSNKDCMMCFLLNVVCISAISAVNHCYCWRTYEVL